MKKVLALLVLMIATFSAVHADNFVEKYKKIYPLEDNAQLIVFSEDSIKKMIKEMDKKVEEDNSEEAKKGKELFKKLKRMSMLFNFDMDVAWGPKEVMDDDSDDEDTDSQKSEQMNNVLSKYEELLSCEVAEGSYMIYADVKNKKIKELICIMTFDGTNQMIFDMEFKKAISLDSWKENLGEVSFNGKKIKDVISESESEDNE